jgi:Zn-dependent protease with chaperone function
VNGAGRLFRLQAFLGALSVLLLAVTSALVIAGSRSAAPSGTAIARACADWLSAGGPAALVGLVVLAAAGAAGVLAVRSLRRQLGAGRAYLGALDLGQERKLGGIRCREVESDQPLAFCAGYLHPRIYLSRGARDQLSNCELDAVLAHEAYHLRRRDPLRRLVVQAAADALFFVPALRRMSERYAALGELAADEAAVAALSDRRPLAAALLKFAEAEPAPAPAAGVDPERVDYLLGTPGAGTWRLRPGSLVASFFAIALLGLLAVLIAQRVVDPSLAPALLLATGCMVGMVLGPAAVAVATVVVSRRALALRAPSR